MIYILIGTKAQFIKMAPVMLALENRVAPYCVVDLSQHGKLGMEMLRSFGIQPQVVTPFPRERSVDSILEGLAWIFSSLLPLIYGARYIKKRFFQFGDGVVLVHGDTMSTLIGVLLARRASLPVALIEAGLRSGKLFSPFPEEFIRRIVERFSNMLFAPGESEHQELARKFPAKQVTNTTYNTGRDALMLMMDRANDTDTASIPIVTLHRLETLSSKRRLESAMDMVSGLAKRAGKLRFVLHPATERALRKYQLLERLISSDHILCETLQPYHIFAHYLASAPFIITDGGSIQEEASYLYKPCIVLRDRTERDHGIGTTARLSSWKLEEDWIFLNEKVHERPEASAVNHELSASNIIVGTIIRNQSSQPLLHT